jgi:flagellar hook-length control protein FliK
VGLTNPVIPEFAGMFSDRPELEPSSDTSGQPLVTGAWPTAPGAADRTPSRSALPVGEDRIRVALPNLVADVQTAETGNTVSSGLPGAASSPSAAADVFPVGLSAQLFHHVMGSVGSGGQEIVLQLHPPELGDLTVRVLVHGREVSAWFATPQIQVQQAVSQAIGQLQTDLGNVGYNLASASIGADAWSPGGSPGERDEGSLTPQQQGAISKSSGERSSGGPKLSSASGVSIYV